MKKKELEIKLQSVPDFSNPKPSLEQYLTPANIASDIIFTAFQFEDIKNKNVVDLGCGTGIFSVGVLITGAKQITGIDIDKECIEIAKDYAEKNKMNIEFLVEDIDNYHNNVDTVIMNPPFGAQKSNLKADRSFIEKGFEIADVIYSLHLTKTVSFIEKLVNSLNGVINYSKEYTFPIKWMFDFHKKKEVKFDVTLLRITT